ncbi:MAG: ATP-binding protein [Bacteroidales bacterium]|nr:ATP-binding protein [Bacteroidales bacterium]
MEKTYVGRKNKLEELNNFFSESKKGLGKLFLIKGNAGIGKSALVREFLISKNNDPEIITAEVECNDKENLNAYAPFKEILIQLNTKNNTKDDKKETRKKNKKFYCRSRKFVDWTYTNCWRICLGRN